MHHRVAVREYVVNKHFNLTVVKIPKVEVLVLFYHSGKSPMQIGKAEVSNVLVLASIDGVVNIVKLVIHKVSLSFFSN